MLLIKIKIARCQSEVALTALAGRYFISICMYCVCSLWPLLVFVIVFRVIFVLYCSLVVILMFVLLYLDLGLPCVLRLIAFVCYFLILFSFVICVIYSAKATGCLLFNKNFKLLSLNARGIRSFVRRKSIFNWLFKSAADICFLQETYSTPEVENEWKGKTFFSHAANQSRGVLILVKDQLDCRLQSLKVDSQSRYVLLEALIQETEDPNYSETFGLLVGK